MQLLGEEVLQFLSASKASLGVSGNVTGKYQLQEGAQRRSLYQGSAPVGLYCNLIIPEESQRCIHLGLGSQHCILMDFEQRDKDQAMRPALSSLPCSSVTSSLDEQCWHQQVWDQRKAEVLEGKLNQWMLKKLLKIQSIKSESYNIWHFSSWDKRGWFTNDIEISLQYRCLSGGKQHFSC